MERVIPYYDMYLDRVVKHVFSDIRPSKYNPKVYYMTEFVRLSPMGEESTADKEFKIGQNYNGYHGYYRAYIFVPSYWKFSSFTAREMPSIVDLYGNKVIYKRIEGPEGTEIDKHNCIGWAYDYGLTDENLIGKEDVSRDIAQAIKTIVDWEWDNEPVMMTRSIVNESYDILDRIKEGEKHNLPQEALDMLNELHGDVTRD